MAYKKFGEGTLQDPLYDLAPEVHLYLKANNKLMDSESNPCIRLACNMLNVSINKIAEDVSNFNEYSNNNYSLDINDSQAYQLLDTLFNTLNSKKVEKESEDYLNLKRTYLAKSSFTIAQELFGSTTQLENIEIRNCEKKRFILSDSERSKDGKDDTIWIVLGEYMPKKDTIAYYYLDNDKVKENEKVSLNTIYLYKNMIKEVADDKKINYEELLFTVFVHELVHAYFDSGDKYRKEYEEALAELGCLVYLNLLKTDSRFSAPHDLGLDYDRMFDMALGLCKGKKKSKPGEPYAMGAFLFENAPEDKLSYFRQLAAAYKNFIK